MKTGSSSERGRDEVVIVSVVRRKRQVEQKVQHLRAYNTCGPPKQVQSLDVCEIGNRRRLKRALVTPQAAVDPTSQEVGWIGCDARHEKRSRGKSRYPRPI